MKLRILACLIALPFTGCLTTGSIAYNDPETGITSVISISKDWADGKTVKPLKGPSK